MAEACNPLPVQIDRAACRVGFAACSLSAERTVRAYYVGTGPDLVTVAHRYAIGEFGKRGDWQAGESGCLEALMDEYRREHH